jgi:hypothetical protein
MDVKTSLRIERPQGIRVRYAAVERKVKVL